MEYTTVMHAALTGLRVVRPATRADQIRAFVREQVLSGALPPGTRLPPTRALAARWGVNVACVQAALAPLVADGLLLRRRRVGTIVRERAAAFARVAIFRPSEPAREGRDHFTRSLATTLAAKLRSAGSDSAPFVDLRAPAEQVAAWPDLERAVRDGAVDAVVACEADLRTLPWLTRLPLPTAILTPEPIAHGAWFDYGQFAREAVAALARRGCRSVGLVSVITPQRTGRDGAPHPFAALVDGFAAAAAAAGLRAPARWRRMPRPDGFVSEAEAERWGYAATRAICGGRERPDGLVVMTDLAARGAVMALLALGDGRPAPRLALHRNAELGLFSPLPADFLEVAVDDVADALLARLARQRRGETLAHALLPFRVVAGDPA